MDTFLNVRIKLNEEVEFKHLPRFTEWKELKKPKAVANGNGRLSNGSKPSPKDVSPKEAVTPVQPPTPTSTAPSAAAPANGTPRCGRIGERGRDGTVRFMLNPDREQDEKIIVAEYSKPAEEEIEQEQQRSQHEPQRNHHHEAQRDHHESQRDYHESQRDYHESHRNHHEPQRNHYEQQRRR